MRRMILLTWKMDRIRVLNGKNKIIYKSMVRDSVFAYQMRFVIRRSNGKTGGMTRRLDRVLLLMVV